MNYRTANSVVYFDVHGFVTVRAAFCDHNYVSTRHNSAFFRPSEDDDIPF